MAWPLSLLLIKKQILPHLGTEPLSPGLSSRHHLCTMDPNLLLPSRLARDLREEPSCFESVLLSTDSSVDPFTYRHSSICFSFFHTVATHLFSGKFFSGFEHESWLFSTGCLSNLINLQCLLPWTCLLSRDYLSPATFAPSLPCALQLRRPRFNFYRGRWPAM